MIHDPAIAGALHMLLEYGGIATGAALYRSARRREALAPMLQPGGFAILVGLLLGAGIGNKLVFLVERPDLVLRWLAGDWTLPGQSIVGGLLGGLLGVEAAKRLTRQPRSTGDLMVLPIAAGLCIGRLGCFLGGLLDDTYGLPTVLPWGVDHGDGIRRHPVALYEIAFVASWSCLLWRRRARWATAPGTVFKLFLAGYLLWRFGVDFLKPVRWPYPLGLSGIQTVCAAALVLYLPFVAGALRRTARASKGDTPCSPEVA